MVSLLSQVFESSKKGRLWWMEVFLYQDCEALPYQYGNLKGHSGQVANVSTPKSKRTLRKWSHLLVGNYPHGYHATKYFAVRPLVNYWGWLPWSGVQEWSLQVKCPSFWFFTWCALGSPFPQARRFSLLKKPRKSMKPQALFVLQLLTQKPARIYHQGFTVI